MESGDTIDRFLLALDHLEVTRDLLCSNSPAKERMAVILLDGFADALIFRRLETLFGATERGWWMRDQMPSYPKKLREKARTEFHLRLKLAREYTYVDQMSGDTRPFAEDLQATILQIGHAYRNDAYHRDRHNPSVIGVIGRLSFVAVTDVFVRAQPRGWGIAIRGSEKRISRLQHYEVDVRDGFLRYRAAAECIANKLRQGMETPTAELAECFKDDLEYRLAELDDGLDYLASSGRDVDEILADTELWRLHGADERLLELAQLMDPFSRAQRAGLKEVPADFVDDAKKAPGEYRRRQRQLWEGTATTASRATVERVREMCALLDGNQGRSKLVSRYHEGDRLLSTVEDCASDAISAYDEAVQHQIDLARGK